MSEGLSQLADDYWEASKRAHPTNALLLGFYEYADQMDDLSRAAEDQRITELEDFAARAEAIDEEGLSPMERITRRVLIEDASTGAEQMRSRTAEFDVDAQGGLQVVLLQSAPQIPVPNVEVADAIVDKWSHLGTTFTQAIERLRQGLARERTPPRIAVEKSIAQIEDYLASDIGTDPFINLNAPPELDVEHTRAWRARLAEQVQHTIRRAYRRYRDALRDEVLPKARPAERTGVCWLSDGEEIYTRAIRRYTTRDLPAMDIHNVGLEEIAQLEQRYRELGTGVLGTDDLPMIYTRLREDEALRFNNAEEIVAAAQASLDRAKAAISGFFGILPRADCVTAEIPQPGAEDAPLAFYLPPAADGTRPGTVFVNTTEPTTRTRYESEALAFHEGIPGHHLQIAIAQELEGIPEFQKHALMTAYVEGWGLYTERLSDEMGLYSGDVERLGILSFDSWRAGRLVVDTGLHALGWSRQEAIDFLVDNSPQAPNNIENEVDRYIAWPGQALAYKIGQRAILAARARAQETMGESFDLKNFHDVVLGSGPVPLGLLDELVSKWTASV